MMKTILKQSCLGVVALLIGMGAGTAFAQMKFEMKFDMKNQFQSPLVEDTQSWKEALEVAESLEKNGGVDPSDISISATNSAYSDVSKAIDEVTSTFTKLDTALQEQADEFEAGFRNNAKMFSADELGKIASDIGEDAMQKAEDIISGKELTRLMDPDVLTAIDKMKQEKGAGLPTADYANMTVGIFNLNSVFGVYDKDLTIQTKDTRMCVIMGGDPKQCCEQWMSQSTGSRLFSKLPFDMSPQMACCLLDKNMCLSVAQEKTGCLLQQQKLSLEAGFKTCAVECKQDYVALSQQVLGTGANGMPVQQFDPNKVEELVKECYNSAAKAADPTVLTSSELAPVVPEPVQQMLTAGQKTADGIGEGMSAVGGAVNEANKAVSNIKGEIENSANTAFERINKTLDSAREQVNQSANGAIDTVAGATNKTLNQVGQSANDVVNRVNNTVSNTVNSTTQAVTGNGKTN